MRQFHRLGFPLSLMIVGLLGSPVPGEAQFDLSPAIWDENISLSVGSTSTSFSGSDLAVPEPHTEDLSGVGYDVTGSVGFGTAGPPEGTATVTWNVAEGGPSLQLSSSVSIDFQLRVIATGTPPVAVSEVPVRLVATGSGSAQEIFGSRATASFRFQAPGTPVLITDTIDVDGNPGSPNPAVDAFTIDEMVSLPVDSVVLVGMSATASMGVVSVPAATTGSATGTIDPVVEVVDETIPGTSSSYREYFLIEFSEGYDAQTPVKRATFGELKARYGEQP